MVYGTIWASTIPTNLPEYKVIIPSRTDKVRSISDSAKFYLVTCEPAKEIYERFGHSGIRVYDPVTKIDEVFHWGLFSFGLTAPALCPKGAIASHRHGRWS